MTAEHSSRERLLVRTFVQFADTLTDDYDLPDFLHRLLVACTTLSGAAAAGLLLTNPQGGVNLLAATSERSENLEVVQLHSHEGPCLDCIATGKPVRSGDLRLERYRWPAWAPAALGVGFRSVYATPMKLRAEVLGAVNLFATTPQALTDDDLDIVRALTDIATIGILQERAITHPAATVTDKLQQALSSRILIEQATGVLAGRSDTDLSPNRAFLLLRDHSRRTHTMIAAVAQDIIDGTLDPTRLTHRAGRLSRSD